MDRSLKVILKETLESVYCPDGPESSGWIELNFSTADLINLTIVSPQFDGMDSGTRLKHIQKHLPPGMREKLGFLSFYTPSEAQGLELTPSAALSATPPHTWQDLAIQAANPQNSPQSALSPHRTQPQPHTVTFYSFKGGVGRTTALIHVAWILAQRGRKVVAVDLDLEAPGLSTCFSLTPPLTLGLVDYFYERAYMLQDSYDIKVADIIGEVEMANAPGRLFVVPAGELSLDYVSKVDDLRAVTVTDGGSSLWSVFVKDLEEQLHPDLILVDSRTGLNQWGSFSLLEAADEMVIFLFPNYQNSKGIEVLLQSLLQSLRFPGTPTVVFSPVPAVTEVGMAKVRETWETLGPLVAQFTPYDVTPDDVIPDDAEKDPDQDNSEDNLDDYSDDKQRDDPLVIGYTPDIALADGNLDAIARSSDYYQKIANVIDRSLVQEQRNGPEAPAFDRWQLLSSLSFPSANAAQQSPQGAGLLFQKTATFQRFLDESVCLIRGRKGTGKTALYKLLLDNPQQFHDLSKDQLKHYQFVCGHGKRDGGRLTGSDFGGLGNDLQTASQWESFWRGYLLIQAYRQGCCQFLNRLIGDSQKFKPLQKSIKSLPSEGWSSEVVEGLRRLAIDQSLKSLVSDAFAHLKPAETGKHILCFLYDDLDEDFRESPALRQQALTGLFQLVQFCDARAFAHLRFKIFLREDLWQQLNFDNKSHFRGRDLSLRWERIDFMRLAYRQVSQSSAFKNYVNRFYPIEDLDLAAEEDIENALGLLWGEKRRRGSKAKYVSRWIYDRLTDSSGTTFPRSLSVLLKAATDRELEYQRKTVQWPKDRLLRSTALDIGLKEASQERCEAITQEYPELQTFLGKLSGFPALADGAELEQLWRETALDVAETFDQFVNLLKEIGLAEWRSETYKKAAHYRFADIYIYGFKMKYQGAR
ncbi:ParA family protein [Prochlorothrix hollandica]|uniref:ParA family protein n=1 Tax=Prochlorothrix hollandica TaxID=1223 RepID=UPI0033413E9D